jgi:long-chain acyl-CoA synthetase
MTQISSPAGSRSLKEVHRRAACIAQGLASFGVGEDDTVALLMRNAIEVFEVNFAAAQLGAYAVPINWHFTAEEVAYILGDCGTQVLIGHTDLLHPLRSELLRSFAALRVIAVITPPDVARAYGVAQANCAVPAGFEDFELWQLRFSERLDPAPANRASMIYTSGTTGKPKGVRRVPMSPSQQTLSAQWMAQYWGFNTRDARRGGRHPDATQSGAMHPGPPSPGDYPAKVLINGPMYHSAPAAYGMGAARAGMRIHLQPRFDALELLQWIEGERITHLHMVPTMFVRLLRLPHAERSRYDLSSLRFVAHGAAPCPAHLKEAMLAWWGPVIHEYYGATETGVVSWIRPEEVARKRGSVGRALPGAVIRIVDPMGRALGPGETGEVFVRSPTVSDFTYQNAPEQRESAGLDGLVSVGDLGWLDDEGYLFLCDRKRDMIISGGVNIYPAEIEAILLQMTGVRDAAVFGIPDEEFGESVCAWIEPEMVGAVSRQAVRGFLEGRIARFKIPKVIEFAANLPREDSGKIFKRKLRERYLLRPETGPGASGSRMSPSQ